MIQNLFSGKLDQSHTLYVRNMRRLGKQGIIEKVEYSEWASPVVPLVKSNGDYSSTINKHMISDVYPLPTLEDIVNT